MKVDRIQSGQQANLAFKGSAGSGLKEYIGAAVKKEVGDVVELANQASQRADMQKIFDIKAFGDNVLAKFEKYLSKMHKNTVLNLKSTDSYPRFNINNSIEPNKNVRVFTWYTNTKAEILHNNEDITLPKFKDLNNINKAGMNDLIILDKTINYLKDINPKDVDKIFLSSANQELKNNALKATGFFQKLAVRKYAKKIDEFAYSIGEESTAKIRVEEYIKTAKELKAQRAEQQAIVKSNRKEAEKILKG